MDFFLMEDIIRIIFLSISLRLRDIFVALGYLVSEPISVNRFHSCLRNQQEFIRFRF